MNLNNPINALSGIPLKKQLMNRDFRKVLSHLILEGLAVYSKAEISTTRIGRVVPTIMPFLLRLPEFIYNRVASSVLRIDPSARSSMYDVRKLI
jgi:2-dehydropantoate 2-reductase